MVQRVRGKQKQKQKQRQGQDLLGGQFKRRKICRFCVNKVEDIDYKDVKIIRRYLTTRGRIIPRRNSGNCAKHQRWLARAIKQARIVALLPFVEK